MLRVKWDTKAKMHWKGRRKINLLNDTFFSGGWHSLGCGQWAKPTELDLGLPVTLLWLPGPRQTWRDSAGRQVQAHSSHSLRGRSDTLHLIKGHESCQERYFFSTKKDLSLLSLKSYNSLCGDGGIYGNALHFLLRIQKPPWKNEINFFKRSSDTNSKGVFNFPALDGLEKKKKREK